MEKSSAEIDVAVVGGGLAGLTAAAFAVRAGATVRLFDAREDLGGRARSTQRNGFHLNQGPHALYKASDGASVIRELGITPRGGNPPLLRSWLSLEGQLRKLPPGRALSQFLGLLRHLGADRRDPGLVHVSAQEWIEGRVSDPVGRQFAASTVRVSSYSGDLNTFSADAAATQLHAAMRGVTYLHGGWSQLVRALDGVSAGGRRDDRRRREGRHDRGRRPASRGRIRRRTARDCTFGRHCRRWARRCIPSGRRPQSLARRCRCVGHPGPGGVPRPGSATASEALDALRTRYRQAHLRKRSHARCPPGR